ncbi:50S ribosomal protein L25 [Candidatus Roizmanbacteria bacterium CG22_combo_CG10-13_8_21_14_all_34_12]|uniref:Large ribosomal subunit protein bL25 n=3 Tax=Candidatus Roizmaniibacteriota TaxID=1752723 RepID=A0A2H0C0W8_9BACT|nr:MAG: 50S ribosomal protein L25 [Candidatus Roizmanbacteria bacterium CG22_combo_CG10-13_8_21_14_all_34_12]
MKGKKSHSSTDKVSLKAELRTIFGKKLNKVRKQGLVPGNIFGPDFKSKSISVVYKDLVKTYKMVGETGIVYISLDKENIPVLIKTIQKHPLSSSLLHIDFRKIDLSKKIETNVPVKAVGISEAVSQKAGVLLIQSETLLVEALPEDIPSHIEVDITVIKDIGQEIKVSDLKKSDKYEIKTPIEKVILGVVAHKEESIVPETAVAAPEIITEAVKEGEEAPVEGGVVPAAPAKKEAQAQPVPKK